MQRIFFENPSLKALPEAVAAAVIGGEDPYVAFMRDEMEFYKAQSKAAALTAEAAANAFPPASGDAPGTDEGGDEFLKGFL